MSSKTPKIVAESAIIMREIVLPQHTNEHTTIFGGVVMSWIDIAAAMVASRHAGRPVVTVHIESITFKEPIKIGNHVLIEAQMNYVGKSSMEIGVKVTAENPYTGDSKVTTTAFLTFVAIDQYGKSVTVPGLNPLSDDEKQRYEDGKNRADYRKKMRK